MSQITPSSTAWLRVVIATAAAPALLLPGPWRVVALAALVSAWFGLRPARRRSLVVGGLLAVAVVLGVVEIGLSRARPDTHTALHGVSERLLLDLDAEAEAVSRVLTAVGLDRDERLAAFRTLEERAAGSGRPRWSWLLIDPDGVAIAWSGRGLVHEFDPADLPRTGRVKRSGYAAVTWASVRPIDAGPDPWRLIVGTSLESGGENEAALERTGSMARMAKTSALLVAVALLCLGLMSLREAGPWVAVLAFLGSVVALGVAVSLPVPVQLGLAASLLAVFLLKPALRSRSDALRVVHGALAGGMLLAASVLLQRGLGPVDLGSRFFGSWPEVLLRLALFVLALGLLPAGNAAEDQASWPNRRRWSNAALVALILGAAFHAVPGLALGLLVTGAAVAAVALRSDRRFGPQRLFYAALLAALSWEIVFHVEIDKTLERAVQVDLAPPTQTELDGLADRIDAYFENVAWDGFVDPDDERQTQDLAFAVWRGSPLATELGFSSLVVEHETEPVSRFSYGLAMSGEGELGGAGEQPEELFLPGWEAALVEGAAPIRYGAGAEALVRYWFLPRPGFRTAELEPGSYAAGLLRDDPAQAKSRHLLPGGAYFGFYDLDGSVRVPPWKGAGDLDLSKGLGHHVATPHGRAAVFAAESESGWRVVLLPTPTLLGGLERIATHALSPVVALSLIILLEFLLNSNPGRLRVMARESWGSYSRRMLILTTGLLIVPVLLLSGFLLRMLADRVQDEQRAAGEAALESAQRILGDYVLALEPGFGIETTLDDELLIWLSGAVHHEVNLYWGSQLYATSKRELFSAGILPDRIPGEIYSQLALQSAGLASRTSRAQGSQYREFYAPLAVPGVPADAIQLFLSMPLLAQEEAAALDLATMRRRVSIVAIFSALLLLAFGRRFVRAFTEPILEIVQGTQRIAEGAPALGYRPRDAELANLADAIDRMAERIAEARGSLLREKEVVDRIVDNITAGVVSVDRRGEVLLLNRTAHGLLGLTVGDPLIEALEQREDLAEVAAFVRGSGREPRQAAAHLGGQGDEAGQWSLVWVPIESAGEPSALFVIEDVTEVFRVQRLEAWAEMARIIAHEVKNPLTPIRLSTEHLREVYRSRPAELDKVFERCTSNILEQVEELRHIAADFSTYSRIPEMKLEPGDLAEEVRALVETYRSAPPPGVTIDLVVEGDATVASFDARLVNRATRNLIENAVRASDGGGAVTITIAAPERGKAHGQIRIRVEDEGPGVEPATLPRIFEPYFSTEEHGTGLGLAIARRIAEEHGGGICAVNRPEGGLAVTMSIPV